MINSSPPTAACPAPTRSGLTLVELLVVVAIIAMIAGLLTPALMGARRSALNAKVKAEMDLLHMALMNYKSEYGSFPPANMAGLMNGSAVNTRHPAYRHLVRIFPRIAEPPSAYSNLAKMSPAQALVFWLRGFYENPEYPLTNGDVAGQKKKLFDFDESRLYAATDYSSGGPQEFEPRGSNKYSVGDFEREYPVYFTGQSTSGLPYVYFDARCYDVQEGNDLYYYARSAQTQEVTAAFPYLTSDFPANPLWSQCHVNSDTFQLIASGLDGRYGPILLGNPKDLNPADLSASFPLPSSPPTSSTYKPANLLSGHADNITNFAPKPLADSISALKND